MDIRDEKQQEVVGSYMKYNSLRSTLILPTGYGKSFIAMKLIQELKADKVLILVNSQILRDENWKEEFIKFGMEDFYNNNVEMATYQKVYKWKEEEHPLDGVLVIADEIDFSGATDKLSKFFYEYTSNRIIGLTGFISKSKSLWFEEHLPVILEVKTHEAVKLGLLNDIKYSFVKFPMTDEESYTYRVYQKRIKDAEDTKNNYLVQWLRGDITERQYQSMASRLDYAIEAAIRERSQFLNKLDSSAEYAKMLVKYYIEKSDSNKVIVFSKLTSQSDKITDNVYNGKNKAKENREIFATFNSSLSSVLGVCSKINRGVNIKGLNIGIWEGFHGSDTQFIQQSGRLRRLAPDVLAEAIVLLPYYKSVDGSYVETQKVVWARKMLKSTVLKHTRIWDYLTIKSK